MYRLNDDPGRNVQYQQEDNSQINYMIDNDDKIMLSYLNNLYTAINGEKMNIDEVKNAVDALSIFNQKGQNNYLKTLLKPECSKGSKIPSSIPVPSAAFQLHNSTTISTNSLGNCAFMFNPYFLYDKSFLGGTWTAAESVTFSPYYLTSLWVNNSSTLTGSDSDNNWKPVNIGQDIPEVYSSYRIVSASIIVKYIGRLDIASGIVGGAIIFDQSNQVGWSGKITTSSTVEITPVHKSFAKYGNFDLAQDSFYHRQTHSVNGIREIYFPLDNSYEEYAPFIKLNDVKKGFETSGYTILMDKDYYKSGFNYFFYAQGAPSSSACFKVDYYINFECLPDTNFLNYMPISAPAPPISNMEKAQYIKLIQNQPITDEKNSENQQNIINEKTNFWNKMKKTFGQYMPGIISIAKNGLLGSIPYLKTGIVIANSLLNNEDVTMS